LALGEAREGEQLVARSPQAISDGLALQAPLANERLALRLDLLLRADVDPILVIGGKFVMQPIESMSEKVAMLMHRAALNRDVGPQCGKGFRKALDEPSLLPCRIHSFFRGLSGLWVCMDAACTELAPEERGGPAGKLYAQPSRERCGCGAPVLEYFTCRYCGTSYARAYTNDVSNPRFLWAEPGETDRMQECL
jgi:hypothetical protein